MCAREKVTIDPIFTYLCHSCITFSNAVSKLLLQNKVGKHKVSTKYYIQMARNWISRPIDCIQFKRFRFPAVQKTGLELDERMTNCSISFYSFKTCHSIDFSFRHMEAWLTGLVFQLRQREERKMGEKCVNIRHQ